MSNSIATRPWTEQVTPALPENPSQHELLELIACAMRRQLEVMVPEGSEMVDGRLVLPLD